MMQKIGLAAATFGAAMLVAGSGTARAEECGSYPGTWNVPSGGLVVNMDDGIIRDVLTSVGEYWTHSVLSGGSTVAYHSTMIEPGLAAGNFLDPGGDPTYGGDEIWNDNNGTWDRDGLAFGPPGPSQVNVGAIRDFYEGYDDLKYISGTGSGPSSAVSWIAGRPTCNFSYSSGQQEQICKRSHGSGLYSYAVWSNVWWAGDANPSPDVWDPVYGFDLWYDLYQYRNIRAVHLGDAYNYNTGGYADGMVCSTFISYLLKRSLANITVSPYTYSGSKVQTTINNLFAKVKDRCIAAGNSSGNCNGIANQVANCFCNRNNCDEVTNLWQSTCGNGSTTATSTSPDRLTGQSGHSGSGSPYSGGAQYTPVFSGSSVYGCWHKTGS